MIDPPDPPQDQGEEPKRADDDRVERPQHNPSGLDLAKGIAAAYRNAEARKPPRTNRRKPQTRAAKAEGTHEPTSLDALLGRVISDNGWEEDLAAHRVLGDWARIVGPEVAQHCAITAYEDGQIAVQADSTAWATQLRLLAPRIVAKLNDEMGDGAVVRLNIHGPHGPSWKSGPRSIRGARGPRDTYG